ncbi:MAG: hydrolase [Thaumarchaeota archaeon]|nr:hydrolase [Nitrososphaerota archaeon]
MDSLLIVIDFQERLIKHIQHAEEILRESAKLIKACKILGVPMIVTEQVKLGKTVEEIGRLIYSKPILKSSFSCARSKDFIRELERMKPKRCIIVGIEAHICVLQTALDLLERGYEVHVALDCIGSRKLGDRDAAIQRMIQRGIVPTTAETVIYELLGTAEHEKFREVLEIVKS